MTVIPANLNEMIIIQGSTFEEVFTFTNQTTGEVIDLTDYSGAMSIKESYDADSSLIDLTEGDGVTVNGVAGTVTLSIAAADTADLAAGSYVYDLELTSGAIKNTWLQGTISICREVTT